MLTREPIPAVLRERLLLLLAAAFLVVGGVTLHLAYPPFALRYLLYAVFSFLISFTTAHVTLARHLPDHDPLLLPAAALLSGWGLLMVGRGAPNFLSRQATWLLLSTLAMLVVVQTGRDLRWLRRYRYTWLLVGLVLLAATLILGVNPSGAGPRLWLGLGGAYFQPSEPLKLLLVVFLASYLAERRELLVSEGLKIGRWRLPPLAYMGPLLAMFGTAVLLLAAQQDLGAAMLFFFTVLTMLYLATEQWQYVVAGLILFILAGVIGYVGSARVALRVNGWLNPWPDASDRAFQIVQSLLAFGSGGIIGVGPGLGRPTYIPAVHTDFVFAAIGEEFGLAGTLAVVALYAILLLRGFRAAARARQPFERLLASGLTASLIIQAWVIMAANVKLAPIAGVTLPFLSYGGSSLLSTFIALGLILRISEDSDPGLSIPRRQSPHPALRRTACAISLALALLAAACGYWSVVRADWLVAREDNPRRVAYEQRIVRGCILDRDGTPLADVEVGPTGLVTRTYPVTEAAPAVGYASLRYGTGGVEGAFDDVLRGEAGRSAWEAAWADLLHRPPEGQDVQLTLDAEWQRLAQDSLGDEAGAAVVMHAKSGAVLAMASSPSFDPAQLDQSWEQLREDPDAPLINRATQGLYQPGAVFQTVVVAEALTEGLVESLEARAVANITRTLTIDGAQVECSEPPSAPHTLASAYAAACPGPIAALGERLGAEGLTEAVERWGLTTPPSLEVPTESADWSSDTLSTTAMLQDTAIGQGALTISPLQVALMAATVGNQGTMPAPRLVQRFQGGEGGWQEPSSVSEPRAILTPSQADALLANWERYDDNISGHWGIAVAGEGKPHTWFIGVTSALGEGPYAVAVLIEHADDPQKAVDVGVALLQYVRRVSSQ